MGRANAGLLDSGTGGGGRREAEGMALDTDWRLLTPLGHMAAVDHHAVP